jgi:hypothetical protein
MDRVSAVAPISLALSLACVTRPLPSDGDTHGQQTSTTGSELTNGSEDAEDGDGDTESGDTGDGDGDPAGSDPCWVPVPPSDCNTAFEPISAEPPLPVHDRETLRNIGMGARADAVEIVWTITYHNDDDWLEQRNYIASNAQGTWQRQFLERWNCGAEVCGPSRPAQIQGSANRTHLKPPYLRREDGQWMRAENYNSDIYIEPQLLAVDPDDRSYLLGVGEGQDSGHRLLWAETDLGCHQLIWRYHACSGAIAAMAVDSAGSVHLLGRKNVGESNQVLVHWLVGAQSVVQTELAPLPMYTDPMLGFAIDDFNELHVCYVADPTTPDDPLLVYAHGHDADDWVSIGIDEPNHDNVGGGAASCEIAVAPDQTAWLTWSEYDSDELFVASVVDDVATFEVIDVDVSESSAALAVDPLGRPWIAYWPGPDDDYFKVAHKDGAHWIIEQIAGP